MATTWWLPVEYAKAVSWRTSESSWDQVTLGSVKFKGLVDISGEGGLDLTKYKPKGKSEARLEFAGYEPFELTIVLQLITQEQWEYFVEKIIPEARVKNSSDIPKPIEVYHPALRVYDIQKIVIKGISLPQSSGDKQIKTVTIKAIEYLPIQWKVEDSGQNSKIITGTGKPLPVIDHKRQVFNSGDTHPPSRGGLGLNGGQPSKVMTSKPQKTKTKTTTTQHPDGTVTRETVTTTTN